MKKYFLILSGLIFLATILAACAPSRLQMDYGTSHQLQKFNQTANPDAGKKVEAAEGMDGRAAQATKEKYQKSFEEKEQQGQSYIIGIGRVGTTK